ncbi:hypothetical protein RhiirB3_388930 [Rhizophagus irregularis]|nr:hypothetical protein RhiirB3_388930 [Rhizophagus irregularis]
MSGRKEAEDLICITEDKQHKVPVGFVQNIKQLQSAYETNKRKRKRGDDDFDYLYGIVTTGRDWHFLLYIQSNLLRRPWLLIPKSMLICVSVRKVLGLIVVLAENTEIKAKNKAKNFKFKQITEKNKTRLTKLSRMVFDRLLKKEKRNALVKHLNLKPNLQLLVFLKDSYNSVGFWTCPIGFFNWTILDYPKPVLDIVLDSLKLLKSPNIHQLKLKIK